MQLLCALIECLCVVSLLELFQVSLTSLMYVELFSFKEKKEGKPRWVTYNLIMKKAWSIQA